MSEEDRLQQSLEGRDSGRARRGAAASARTRTAGPDDRDERENRDEAEEDDGRPENVADEERFLNFVDSQNQSVLPDLPSMPGYHVCWLTTSNPRDSITMRLNWGYEILTPGMVPGWQSPTIKNGDHGPCIMVNEMIAARIRLPLYRKMMRHLHHDLPLSEEEKLKSAVEGMKENAARSGGRLDIGDGTAEIVQRASVPEFSA